MVKTDRRKPNTFIGKIAPGICAVTGYRGEGDIEPFVIPDKINGLEVVEIASSFTMNMPCGKLTAKRLSFQIRLKKS